MLNLLVCSLYPWQLYRGVLCGILTSIGILILEQFTFTNNYTHTYLHLNLVFLVFIWNHIIHLSSTFPNIHQGLIFKKNTSWSPTTMATTQQLFLNLHNIPITSLPLSLFIFKSFLVIHSPSFSPISSYLLLWSPTFCLC